VRQGGVGGEIEDEVVVDPGALGHEEVAAVEEMPATWARTEYMINSEPNVPVNRPGNEHSKQ
jgi:hypothetical protein